ncbi:MAG: methyltransferase domain-containing protein [Nocardiopsaceae bacterium]|nr:methyltransferase domain-containing protein [Nocardiopsaceae bacterium]
MTAPPASATGPADPVRLVTGPAGLVPETAHGTQRLHAFYADPGTVFSSGEERARRQVRMLAAALAARPGPQVVVDVGCGDGAATHQVRLLDPRNTVIGVDWSATALARARARGLAVVQGGTDGAGLPLADSCADVIIMSELIEHLVDTDAAADEARRVLRPDGILLLSTPNLAAWFNRGLICLGLQPAFSEVSLRGVYGRPGSQVAGHLRLFTRRALVEFLAARGFTCERIAGAPYHDVPRPLRPLDRALCHWPSLASILLVQARVKPAADLRQKGSSPCASSPPS